MVSNQHKTIIITQARVGSKRLPLKITKTIGDETVLSIHLKRLKKSRLASKIVVATTFEEKVNQIIEIAKKCNVEYYQGSTNDVLDRYYKAAKFYNPDYIVRVTSDCPLVDPELIDKLIDFILKSKCDYVSNILIPNYPDGQDVEVFKFKALKIAYEKAKSDLDREHVTSFIENNSSFHGNDLFKSKIYYPTVKFEDVRMTIDHEEDFKAINSIVSELGIDKSWLTYAKFIVNNPDKFSNQKFVRNEGYVNSIKDKNYE
tara:strand:+ start:185 stop:961 length:777 start_codon:yes stop_codon:yes gene_type:complete